MKRRFRSPSLFWTFAGAFLVVLIAATALQVLVIATIVEPVATQWAESRADLIAREAAQEIGAALAESPEADIRGILRSHHTEVRPIILAYRPPDGRIIADRPMPPQYHRRLQSFMPPPPDTITGRHDLRWPRRGPIADREGRRRRVLSRYPVVLDSGVAGEVIAWAPPRRFALWPRATPWPILLSVPIAVLLAGSAGLVMFRLLLKRLRALDNLAARVTAGDLDARVPNPGADEIGQLGTRLNRMTESLAEAKQRIEESDRQRRQLLADISHELATPLTSIHGYAETLLEPSVPVSEEERSAYLQNVLEESRRMELLIQDLLDLTRLEAGAISLERVRLDWTALCRNTMNRFESRFREEGLKILWSGPAEQAWILADGRRLEQVLENLLTNALRYVPLGGTVTLSLEPVPETLSPRFRLTVADDGPGFPPEDLPHIFDRFYRADAARSTGGSGLGLAIVQEIIRLHGGETRAENRKPVGASILVELPASETTASTED